MARTSFMSVAAVAIPPSMSAWQTLASTFASDSATLISRLVVLVILITMACGLHLSMRRPSVSAPTCAPSRTQPTSTASNGTGEQLKEGIEMNNLHSVDNRRIPATGAGGPYLTVDVGDVAASTLSATNTVLLDVASIAFNAS